MRSKKARDVLHVIRTDVLLYALGGFEEKRDLITDRPTKRSTLTDHQIREIKKLAALPRTPFGTGAEIARRIGMDYRPFIVTVCKIRKNPNDRPSWAAVPMKAATMKA